MNILSFIKVVIATYIDRKTSSHADSLEQFQDWCIPRGTGAEERV